MEITKKLIIEANSEDATKPSRARLVDSRASWLSGRR